MNVFAHLRHAARSDVGRRRSNNEDSFGEFPESGVFCVSDGMGGGDDGEVASTATVAAVEGFCKAHPPPSGRAYSIDDEVADICTRLNETSAWINARTHDKRLKTCGATFVGVCFDAANPSRAAVLHAGDSRLYRMRGRNLKQITKDHSAAELIGVKNEKDINPMFRGMILRAVGVQPSVEIERTPMQIQAGDRVLICSDGLSKMVEDSGIAALLRGIPDTSKAVDALIAAANDAGGTDNVTVVLVDVGRLPTAVPTMPLADGASDDESPTSDDASTASGDTGCTVGDASHGDGSTAEAVPNGVAAPDSGAADKRKNTMADVFTPAALARRRRIKIAVAAMAFSMVVSLGSWLGIVIHRRKVEESLMEIKRHEDVARAAEELERRAAAHKAAENRIRAEEARESERRRGEEAARARALEDERRRKLSEKEERAARMLAEERQKRVKRNAELDAERMRKVDDAEREKERRRASDKNSNAVSNAVAEAADAKALGGTGAYQDVASAVDVKTAGDFVDTVSSLIELPGTLYGSFKAMREEDGGEAVKSGHAVAVVKDVQMVARRLSEVVARDMPKIDVEIAAPETSEERRGRLREQARRYREFLAAKAVFVEGRPDGERTWRLCAEMIRKVPEWFRR